METSLAESSAEAGTAALDFHPLAPQTTDNGNSVKPRPSTKPKFVNGRPPWEARLIRLQSDVASTDRRLWSHLSEGHRLLLNAEIEEIAGIDLAKIEEQRRIHFQLGASQWTQIEYETFLRAVTRKGKNAVKDIATAIGSKSEVEVQCLLLHLNTASEQRSSRQNPTGPPTIHIDFMTDIPAAIELSDECCKALDKAATALSWFSDKNDIGLERTMHGENWLLDRNMAEMLSRAYEREENERHGVEPAMDSGEESDEEYSEEEQDDLLVDDGFSTDSHTESHSETDSDMPPGGPLEGQPNHTSDMNGEKSSSAPQIPSKEDEDRERAALEYWTGGKLFNAPNWLELMRDLFMSQVPPDEPYRIGSAPNWLALALRGQEPSIFYTAFSDFYNLAINITRRLVRVCINQALSRVRARDQYLRLKRRESISNPMIKLDDAIAAIESLNMPRNSEHIFARVPRKFKLALGRLTCVKPKDGKTKSSYHLFEEAAGSRSYKKKYARAREIMALAQQSDSYSVSSGISDVESAENEERDGLDRNPISAKDLTIGNAKHQTEEHRAAIDLGLDPITEAFDNSQDAREELELWKTLGINPPEKIKNRSTEFSIGRPGRFASRQRASQGVVEDWRDWTDYRAEWESYGHHFIGQRHFMATEMLMWDRRAKRLKRKRGISEAKAARKRRRVEQQQESNNDELVTSNQDEIEGTDNTENEASEQDPVRDEGSDQDVVGDSDEDLQYPPSPPAENMVVEEDGNDGIPEDFGILVD